MKTNPHLQPNVFPQNVATAVANLKQQLQRDYEHAYPALGKIVQLVLDEEESRAWELSHFPHLLLPDLVEAHIEKLSLEPIATAHEDVSARHESGNIGQYEPAALLCA